MTFYTVGGGKSDVWHLVGHFASVVLGGDLGISEMCRRPQCFCGPTKNAAEDIVYISASRNNFSGWGIKEIYADFVIKLLR